ncbi:hypothetical protein JHFBIEKO_4811 [Methylobacterium mesophilicum]|uniref:hypothetical protein n=1 Tax=Methylobacterium mesophilicum TaxID=39956 RepID=UPI001EE1DF19|nr:hypothetical protein [Methylobacterium mesophilicum]GJE24339.1 hypothetical protein JHFBIEKO_4811 [Methylobacterium mesophilicum]
MQDAESAYFRDAVAYSERALLIIIGATVTVLAGFLSQVWGSAGLPFRIELAKSLTSFGWLLTCCFALPPLRLISLRPVLATSWVSIPFFLVWAVSVLAAAIYYMTLLKHLGETILQFAAVAA